MLFMFHNFSSSKSTTACQDFFLYKLSLLFVRDYTQYFCSAAAEPTSQPAEGAQVN